MPAPAGRAGRVPRCRHPSIHHKRARQSHRATRTVTVTDKSTTALRCLLEDRQLLRLQRVVRHHAARTLLRLSLAGRATAAAAASTEAHSHGAHRRYTVQSAVRQVAHRLGHATCQQGSARGRTGSQTSDEVALAAAQAKPWHHRSRMPTCSTHHGQEGGTAWTAATRRRSHQARCSGAASGVAAPTAGAAASVASGRIVPLSCRRRGVGQTHSRHCFGRTLG